MLDCIHLSATSVAKIANPLNLWVVEVQDEMAQSRQCSDNSPPVCQYVSGIHPHVTKDKLGTRETSIMNLTSTIWLIQRVNQFQNKQPIVCYYSSQVRLIKTLRPCWPTQAGVDSIDKTTHLTPIGRIQTHGLYFFKQTVSNSHTRIHTYPRQFIFPAPALVYLRAPRYKSKPCAGAGSYYSNTFSLGSLQ